MPAASSPYRDIMRAGAVVRGKLRVDRVIGRGIFIPADAERSRFARTARTRFAVAFAFTRRRGALILRLGHQPRAVLDRDRVVAPQQPPRGRITPRADPTADERGQSHAAPQPLIETAILFRRRSTPIAAYPFILCYLQDAREGGSSR